MERAEDAIPAVLSVMDLLGGVVAKNVPVDATDGCAVPYQERVGIPLDESIN